MTILVCPLEGFVGDGEIAHLSPRALPLQTFQYFVIPHLSLRVNMESLHWILSVASVQPRLYHSNTAEPAATGAQILSPLTLRLIARLVSSR